MLFLLQEKLLEPQFFSAKPDEEFLQSLAGLVGSRWPSLALPVSERERNGGAAGQSSELCPQDVEGLV